MVATLILVRAENGDLYDQDGHLRNPACQRLDYQRVVIHDQVDDIAAAAQAVDETARPRTMADYNHPDQYYANRSAIRPPAIHRKDFEMNPSTLHSWCRHHTVVYHTSILWTIWGGSRIWSLPLKPMESLRTISFASSSSTHFLERLRTGSSSYHQDLLHYGPTSRTHSCIISLMWHALNT